MFSGAASGAEAEFGAAAERHGIEEVNFTFEGHNDARQRGIRVLTARELQRGGPLHVDHLHALHVRRASLQRLVHRGVHVPHHLHRRS